MEMEVKNPVVAKRITEKEFVANCDLEGIQKVSYHNHFLGKIFDRKHIEDSLYETMEMGFKDYGNDFYIVQLHHLNPDLPNQIEFNFIARKSMPTPHWHQNVYHASRENGLCLVWSIPHRGMPDSMLDPKQKDFKRMFLSGELIKMVEEREKQGYL